MKTGIVVFPGSDSEDLAYIIEKICGRSAETIWHQDEALEGYGPEDYIILPAGFSYGDYIRSGALARTSPVMKAVTSHARNGGRIIGIGNGFQILCEAGLLPGSFLQNAGQKHISRLVNVRVETTRSVLTRSLKKGDVLTLPVSHSSGRYYCDEKTLAELKQNDRILFRYSNSDGSAGTESNISGSTDSIAGICDEGRKVTGLMPLPERAAESIVGLKDGLRILEGLFNTTNKEV